MWLIRASMVHLLSGALLGAAYLSLKAAGWFVFSASHLPVHVEQMLIGWLVQLVIGVAYWILPRRAEQDPVVHTRLMWLVFVLLNGGVLVAALGEDPGLPRGLALGGRIAETLAVVLFASHAWRRQRAYRAGARTVLV